MDKKPIGVIVDEAADLTREIIEKYNIGVVPLSVHWPEIENIPGENIYQKIRELEKKKDKSFGKTSQPSPKAFMDIFQRQLEFFEKIICLTITSKHSGTFNSACQAKKFMGEAGNNVFVIDSLNASAGSALVVLRTIDLIEKGFSVEETVKEIESFVPKVRLYILIEDPKRLEASGRMSGMVANWVRRMQAIGIRPLLGLKEGKLGPIGIKRSKDMPTALFNEIETKTKDLRKEGKRIRVAITHADVLDRAEALKEILNTLENTEIAIINLADDVLGSLVGPGALVAAWAPLE